MRRRMTFRQAEALIQGLSWDASTTGLSWDSKHRGLSWDSSTQAGETPPTRGLSWDASTESSETSPTRGLSWDASVDVADVLQSLRAEALVEPSESLISRLTISAVAEHRDTPQRLTPLRRSRFALIRRRIATLGTSLVLALGGSAGMAIAANDALPGDQLYGLDRALEQVGIGDGGSAERLGEALALVERGDVAEGLTHAADNLTELSADSNAGAALEGALERLLEERDNPSDNMRAQVAALLEYLADNEGDVDGQQVSDLAQEIGRQPDEMPEQSNRPEVPPGQSESETPPGQGGPPETPPGQGGPPETPPGQGGPPETPPGQGNGGPPG